MHKISTVTALLAGLVAISGCDDKVCSDTAGDCDSAVTDDTGSTGDDTSGGIYTGDTLISAISWNCDDLGYFWFIDYAGWSGVGDLWFSQTTESAWSEVHSFTPTVEDPTGYLSSYEITLDSVYDEGLGAVQEGTTTFFDCFEHEFVHIFQFDLWNETSDTIADCALFGDDPDGDTAPFSVGAGSGWPGDCTNLW